MLDPDKKPDTAAPRVSFVSLGCPKALVDSERIVTRLRAEGYELSRELVWLDVGISRALGLIQKPAHAAVTTQRTNSLQLLRQIDCRCAVINIEQVPGQTIVPFFGNSQAPRLGG